MEIRFIKRQFVSAHPTSEKNYTSHDIICPICRGAFSTREIEKHVNMAHALMAKQIFLVMDVRKLAPTCRCGQPVSWSWDKRDWEQSCNDCKAALSKLGGDPTSILKTIAAKRAELARLEAEASWCVNIDVVLRRHLCFTEMTPRQQLEWFAAMYLANKEAPSLERTAKEILENLFKETNNEK